jgi:hypothetical protein
MQEEHLQQFPAYAPRATTPGIYLRPAVCHGTIRLLGFMITKGKVLHSIENWRIMYTNDDDHRFTVYWQSISMIE